jgi:hypothetical protein
MIGTRKAQDSLKNVCNFATSFVLRSNTARACARAAER